MKELRQVALAVAINCATSKNEYETFMDVSIKEDMNRRISGKSGQGMFAGLLLRPRTIRHVGQMERTISRDYERG